MKTYLYSGIMIKNTQSKQKNEILFFIIICLILLPVLSCRTAGKGDFEKAALSGMVYDYENRPVSGVSIFIDEKFIISSDVNGRFILPDVKRGEHVLEFRKKGHERLVTDIDFLNRTQVLYIKILSLNQILNRVEELYEKKEWAEASDFLERGKAIDENNPLILYLEAVYEYKIKHYDNAEKMLQCLLDKGFNEPYIYLFLADIYEYNFLKKDKAVFCLERYLELRGSREIEERLKNLKKY